MGMQSEQNISLKNYNSFGIETIARDFCIFKNTEELLELSNNYRDQILSSHFILGGGSNILFTSPRLDTFVLKNELTGIALIDEDANHYYVEAAAGENWHQFVLFCISMGWAGVENLSLIPGSVGASPIQNIGAYGVEVKDLIASVEAYHIADRSFQKFSNEDCAFGYRESVFKNKWKNQFVITHVTYRLSKNPVINSSYGAIEAELEKKGIKERTIQSISDAVISIRSGKLPDPKEIGNAGSFFKNPSISTEKYEKLKSHFQDVVGYPNKNGTIKIAAGWLIERAGWKGYRSGDAGCHSKQALVLVNYGHASGSEIFAVSEKLIESIHAKFGIELEREVNIL